MNRLASTPDFDSVEPNPDDERAAAGACRNNRSAVTFRERREGVAAWLRRHGTAGALMTALVVSLSASSQALAQTTGGSTASATAEPASSLSFEDQLKLAKTQARSARVLLKKQDYHGARPLLEGAYAILPDAQTLLELVQCYRGLSLHAQALQLILDARASGNPQLNPNETKAIEKHKEELEPLTSRLRLIVPVSPAVVRIDGVIAKLPANAVPIVLAPGLHAVQVEAEGYELYTKELTAVAGKDEQLTAELEKWVDTGRLKVVDKAGLPLDVTIDGQVVGLSPWEGDVPAGTHTVAGRNKRAVAAPTTVEVPRRGAVDVTLEGTVQYERVAFQVAPADATITLDGQRVTAPYDNYLILGQHQLLIEAPGYTAQERLFTLSADAPFVEGISLVPAGMAGSPPKVEKKPNPFRFGFLVGIVSLPRPINVEVTAKPNDFFSVGLGFSMIPKIKVSNGAGDLNAFNAVGRVFPFGGSFYVGAAVGRQSLSLEADDTVDGEHITASAEHASLFVTPQVGWLFVWDSGFTLGINVGAQIALSSSPKVRLRNDRGVEIDPTETGPDADELRDNVRTASRYLARYPLPNLDLLKIGFLF